MRRWLVLAVLLLIGSRPASADWSISLEGISGGGFIGFSIGDGRDGTSWSFSYGYSRHGSAAYPGYGYWGSLDDCDWPSYPYYPSCSLAFGYSASGSGCHGYSSPANCYWPTNCCSSRYYSSYPSHVGGHYSSRPRHNLEGRYGSHDYRGESSGDSRGYSSSPSPACYSADRSSPPPAAYYDRDRGQQVYWNSRTSIGGSPSTGDRPYRAPPMERTVPAARGGDRGARYGR